VPDEIAEMSRRTVDVDALAEAGVRLLGAELRRAVAVHGGALSQIVRIELADGRAALVKTGQSTLTEAAMLDAIAESGAPAPTVLAADEHVLVMEVLPSGGSLHAAWGSLGRVLARLHTETGTRYGWANDYAFGSVAIANAWHDSWPAFWAERRLLIHAAEIGSRTARRLEALALDLDNRIPSAPEPVLLHGDLWGGNVVVAGRDISGLVDPACYYGHCEVDIAMLTLFDSPSSAFFDAYGPFETGFDERLRIYQLWPALVHLRLFGGGYQSMVDGLLSASGV
jgi:fructosamine-3-kinase